MTRRINRVGDNEDVDLDDNVVEDAPDDEDDKDAVVVVVVVVSTSLDELSLLRPRSTPANMHRLMMHETVDSKASLSVKYMDITQTAIPAKDKTSKLPTEMLRKKAA
jgi:hypothetical protein